MVTAMHMQSRADIGLEFALYEGDVQRIGGRSSVLQQFSRSARQINTSLHYLDYCVSIFNRVKLTLMD